MRRIALTLAAALALGVAACGGDDARRAPRRDTSKPLVVGASPVPHAEILNYIASDLAPKAGLKLEVKEFTDYVLPNTALVDHQLDANYFQTPAYLDDQEQARGFKAVSIVGVHIEPLGALLAQGQGPREHPAGRAGGDPQRRRPTRPARCACSPPTSCSRSRRAPARRRRSATSPTNPKDLKFAEVEAAQTPRALDDADLAVINGNYALEADLTPAKDALVLEQAENNPNPTSSSRCRRSGATRA